MTGTTREIKFQEIKLRLPTPVIDYVRRMYGDPKQWLEYYLVDWIRIDVEMKTNEELKQIFNLGPVFKRILG